MSMSTCRFKCLVAGLIMVVFAGCLPARPAVRAHGRVPPDLDKIPRQVMDTLQAKFPKAEIDKWTREREGAIVVYDFEFKQEGRKFEADIKEDGTIHNWEREIAAKDLPDAVKKAVEMKYPNAVLKEILAITAVKGGKDALEGYEIVLETADKKVVEVTIAPDGKTLEDEAISAENE
jgi:hypothetical protein